MGTALPGGSGRIAGPRRAPCPHPDARCGTLLTGEPTRTIRRLNRRRTCSRKHSEPKTAQQRRFVVRSPAARLHTLIGLASRPDARAVEAMLDRAAQRDGGPPPPARVRPLVDETTIAHGGAVEARREAQAEELEDLADVYREALRRKADDLLRDDEKLSKVNPKDLALTTAILTDKPMQLRGEATSVVEHRSGVSLEDVMKMKAELAKEADIIDVK